MIPKKFRVIFVLALLCLLNLSSISADTITKDGITIESDKSYYYCEPDQSGQCLIRAIITVTNDNPDQTYTIKNSFSTPVVTEPIKVDALAYITETTDKPLQIDDVKSIAEVSDKETKVGDVNIYPIEKIAPQEILILKEREPRTFEVEFWVSGSGKFDVNINTENNGIITLDPYYYTTNTTPPRAEFNAPSGQQYSINTTVNISADALDYYNITSVTFQVEKPNGVKTNFSALTQPEYWALRDENDTLGNTTTNNFGTYFGDIFPSTVTLGKTLMKNPKTTNFNRIAFEINSISGNPQWQQFIYNITICETNVTTLTNSANRTQDCISPIFVVGKNSDLSAQIGTLNLNNFALLKLDNNYTMQSGNRYIFSFEYVSSLINGASDFWTIRLRGALPNSDYLRVLSTNATFLANYLPNLKIFSDYTYSYNDTALTGRYNITLFATDFHGNTNISATYFTVCEPNWQCIAFDACNTSDLQTCNTVNDTNACGYTYTGNYSEFTQPCNYCSEDIVQVNDSACAYNGTDYSYNYSFSDNNFFSCCAVTGLVSDCSIQYSPYNQSYTDSCLFLESDFSLDLDLELYFGFGFGGLKSDKVHGKIWLNDTNNTYTCLTYVKTTDGQIVQTNPPYTKRTESTISITPKEIEDREFFVTQQGLANVYWTENNLVIDGRQYIFGVECGGNGDRLISEQISTVGYKNLNAPVTRYFWLGDNIVPVIIGMIGLLAIAIFIGMLYRRVKYG